MFNIDVAMAQSFCFIRCVSKNPFAILRGEYASEEDTLPPPERVAAAAASTAPGTCTGPGGSPRPRRFGELYMGAQHRHIRRIRSHLFFAKTGNARKEIDFRQC